MIVDIDCHDCRYNDRDPDFRPHSSKYGGDDRYHYGNQHHHDYDCDNSQDNGQNVIDYNETEDTFLGCQLNAVSALGREFMKWFAHYCEVVDAVDTVGDTVEGTVENTVEDSVEHPGLGREL